jgi:hypothetical protein
MAQAQHFGVRDH